MSRTSYYTIIMEQATVDSIAGEAQAQADETLDEAAIGGILHSQAAKLMPVHAFSLALYRRDTQKLEYRYCMENNKNREPCAVSVLAQDCLSAYCVRTGRDILSSDIEKDLLIYCPDMLSRRKNDEGEESMASGLYCPVWFQNRVIALVSVRSRQPAAYDEHHRGILNELCVSAGSALENARLAGEIRQISEADPLTGALSRGAFMELFLQETRRLSHYPDDLGFIIYDLDHFKLLSDTHGPDSTAAILQNSSRLAAKGLRSTDRLARFGDEEFALLLPHTGIEGAAAVAERIRAKFERETMHLAETCIKYTASFGVASYSINDDFDSLRARADKALLYSRDTGGNKVASEKAAAYKPKKQPGIG